MIRNCGSWSDPTETAPKWSNNSDEGKARYIYGHTVFLNSLKNKIKPMYCSFWYRLVLKINSYWSCGLLCSDVVEYQSFRGSFCPSLQGESQRNYLGIMWNMYTPNWRMSILTSSNIYSHYLNREKVSLHRHACSFYQNMNFHINYLHRYMLCLHTEFHIYSSNNFYIISLQFIEV
jgi:hypothetical protein